MQGKLTPSFDEHQDEQSDLETNDERKDNGGGERANLGLQARTFKGSLRQLNERNHAVLPGTKYKEDD